MVEKPSTAERLAALLATVPGVCLGIDLPERPRSSGGVQELARHDYASCVAVGRYSGPRQQAARPGAAMGLVPGVKLHRAELPDGATICESDGNRVNDS